MILIKIFSFKTTTALIIYFYVGIPTPLTNDVRYWLEHRSRKSPALLIPLIAMMGQMPEFEIRSGDAGSNAPMPNNIINEKNKELTEKEEKKTCNDFRVIF